MKPIARIALATALLMIGATFAIAQHGAASGGSTGKDPNLYDYYSAGPLYAPSYSAPPYYDAEYNYYYPPYTYGYVGPRQRR